MPMKRAPDTWFAAGYRGLVVVEVYEKENVPYMYPVVRPKTTHHAGEHTVAKKSTGSVYAVNQFFVELFSEEVAYR